MALQHLVNRATGESKRLGTLNIGSCGSDDGFEPMSTRDIFEVVQRKLGVLVQIRPRLHDLGPNPFLANSDDSNVAFFHTFTIFNGLKHPGGMEGQRGCVVPAVAGCELLLQINKFG